MTLESELVSHFKLPNESFLHKTLIGWLGLEEWTQEHGNPITIYHDGSIKVCKKTYDADSNIKDFLHDMEKRYSTLYDKEMKNVCTELHSLYERIRKMEARVPDNGWNKHNSHLTHAILRTQCESIRNSYELLNSLANLYSSYGA